MFELTIRATGEVRDAEGNLLSAEPVEFRMEVPESHLAAVRGLAATDLGDEPPDERDG